MDQTEFNPQNAGICHKLLISILPIDCPVCKGLAICSRLFKFRASAAPSLAPSTLSPRISGGIFHHVFLILQRLHDSIMQILAAQAIKPVTLGSFKDNSSIQTPDFHASRSENGIETMNDETMQLAPHQDPSVENDYQPMTEESQAKEVDDSASMLTDLGSSYDYPGDERELSQVVGTTDDDVHSSPSLAGKVDKEAQKKVPTPTVMQKARAPKKMVSINENVEIFPTSKTKRVMSKEWSSAFESGGEKSKPLKSILKVGSKLTDVNTE